jgi:hypothetical protein
MKKLINDMMRCSHLTCYTIGSPIFAAATALVAVDTGRSGDGDWVPTAIQRADCRPRPKSGNTMNKNQQAQRPAFKRSPDDD